MTERPRPTALLLHHAAGSASDWSDIAGLLSERMEVLAPDMPGHGMWVLGEPLRSVEAMAAHVAGMLRDRRGGPVVAVGHSMGGAVALHLALDHPELVGGLVLISTGARLRVAQALMDVVREHFPQLPQQMIAMGFASTADPAVVARWMAAPWAASPAAALADFAACDRYDVRVRLGEVKVPAVVMVGEQDMMTPEKRSQELVSGIPGARLRLVPGAGHLLPWERPREVVEEILALAGLAGETSGGP
jgi:pimeloyl-ACP methyl ester carboxylesterase